MKTQKKTSAIQTTQPVRITLRSANDNDRVGAYVGPYIQPFVTLIAKQVARETHSASTCR